MNIKHEFNINNLTEKEGFLDLRELKTYTIDDKNTVEIDDAISLEGEKTIWIHISLPSYFIELKSEISINALSRACTLYNSEESVYMLPKDLITNNISLLKGRESLALSIKVSFRSNGEVDEFELYRTIIKPNYKLNYEEADEILDYQPKEEYELVRLKFLLKEHFESRIKKGAINIDEPIGYLIKEKNKILKQIRLQTESRKLVSEAMIIYNHLISKFCTTNNIIIPYRTQEKPRFKYKIEKNLHIHIYNYLLKNSLSKSNLELDSKPHYSLGLDSYTFATSPLRRYIDFLIHHQILLFLKGNKTLTKEAVAKIVNSYNNNFKRHLNISRSIKRGNYLKWFSNEIDNTYSVLFIRWLNKAERVLLLYFEDLYIDIVCTLRSPNNFLLGDQLLINILDVDITNDKILISIEN